MRSGSDTSMIMLSIEQTTYWLQVSMFRKQTGRSLCIAGEQEAEAEWRLESDWRKVSVAKMADQTQQTR